MAEVTRKIVRQEHANLTSLANRQIGVMSGNDADLGYRMWGGKDGAGTVTYFLAKGEAGLLETIKLTGSTTNNGTAGVLQYSGTGDVTGGADLTDLADVTISTPADNQVLTYNSASSIWENADPPDTGTLDDGYDNFGTSPAIVVIDGAEAQGDLRLNPSGDFSLVVDVSNCTNTADGFQVTNGADYFHILRQATDILDIEATVRNFELTADDIKFNGDVGIGVSTISAYLHIDAGTATAGDAPLKFTAGTNLTSPEAGAIEFDGTNLYFTDSTPTRQTIATLANMTLDGAYNNDTGDRTVTVDDGKVSWEHDGSYNFDIYIENATGDYGFQVYDDSDYFRLYKAAGGGSINLDSELRAILLKASSTFGLQDSYLSSPVYLSQSGTTGLSGYTATSIIAALNEVKADVSAISVSLDDAYDGGNTIDVDGDPVTLTVSDGDNNSALKIVQNDVTNNPYGLEIENNTTFGLGSISLVFSGTNRTLGSQDDGTNLASMRMLMVANNPAPVGNREMRLTALSYTDEDVDIYIEAQQAAAGAGRGQVYIIADQSINIGSSSVTPKINIGRTSGGAVDIDIEATGTEDITFAARGGTATTYNDASDASLSGYTATSLIGALNEVRATAPSGLTDGGVVFSNGGVLATDTGLTFDSATDALTIGGDVTLTSGGTITTSSNGDLVLMPNGTGVTIIGAGSHTYLADQDDLYISGSFEIQHVFYLHGDMTWISGGTLRSTSNGNVSLEPHGTGVVACEKDVRVTGGNGAYTGVRTTSEEVTISVGQGSGGVVTSGNLAPANSLILSAVARVTDAPGGGATTLDIGITGSGNLDSLIDGMSTAVDTTGATPSDGDGTQMPLVNGTATTLTLTTDSDVTVDEMKVRVIVSYIDFDVPTS